MEGRGRNRSRHRSPSHRPRSRPWVRKWSLYAPPTTSDAGVPTPSLTFRVVSFNVLADYIAMRDVMQEKPEESWKIEWSYRRQRLVREILSWMPDIVCLQEVDHFHDFFEPELRKSGFTGVFKKRTGDETLDGCATFVKSAAFSIVSTHPLEFHTPGHPILDRPNIALQTVIEWRQPVNEAKPYRFIVANTHLLFNPGRGDVKLAQLQRLFESLAALRTVEAVEGVDAPVVLCGDFNLSPQSALYEFISRGALDVSGLSKHFLSGQTMDERTKQAMFRNENDAARHQGHGTMMGRFDSSRAVRRYFHHFPRDSIATHPLQLASAYAQMPTDHCTGEPKFTTFHDGSKATVDYIWYTSESVHCHGVMEMVPAGLLFQAKMLPTEHHSSDHLALIADFSIKSSLSE